VAAFFRCENCQAARGKLHGHRALLPEITGLPLAA